MELRTHSYPACAINISTIDKVLLDYKVKAQESFYWILHDPITITIIKTRILQGPTEYANDNVG